MWYLIQVFLSTECLGAKYGSMLFAVPYEVILGKHSMWDKISSTDSDLLTIKQVLYDQYHFTFSGLEIEAEGSGYAACAFKLNSLDVKFRSAKITPKKIGQFVTLWKRIADGPTQPYDAKDSVAFFVISVRRDNHFGQFVFPKAVLIEKSIFSLNGSGGKRGIRVYPPWDKAENSQAKKTQKWQLQYFLDLTSGLPIDV